MSTIIGRIVRPTQVSVAASFRREAWRLWWGSRPPRRPDSPEPIRCRDSDPSPSHLALALADGIARGRRPAEPRDHHGRRHGVLRHRLLRRRDRHAEPRRPGRRRPPLHAVLQRRPLLPDPRLPADRPLCPPGRRRPHDGTTRTARLSRRPQPLERHHRRGAEAGRLHDPDGRQVARLPARARRRERPDRPRLRPLLRHHPRRRQLLRPDHPDPRHRGHRARDRRLLLHRRHRRQCRVDDRRRHRRRPPLLPLRRLHRAPLAAPRPGAGHRPLRGTLRRGLGRPPGRALPADDRPRDRLRPLAALAPRPERAALGRRQPTRSGRPAGWRSMPRRSS